MNNTLSIGETGSLLMGAGLPFLVTDLKVGLALIGSGVLLKVLVAILQKNGYDVRVGPDIG